MSCGSDKTITEIKRGSTFEQTITCLDESDVAVNLSGWSVSSDLKESPGASGLLSFTVDSGSFVGGVVGISATPAETLVLPEHYNLQYDLKFTEPGGNVYYTETMYLKTSRHITD